MVLPLSCARTCAIVHHRCRKLANVVVSVRTTICIFVLPEEATQFGRKFAILIKTVLAAKYPVFSIFFRPVSHQLHQHHKQRRNKLQL
jgi:hypothetical protein